MSWRLKFPFAAVGAMSLRAELLAAIHQDGRSLNELTRAAGLPQSVLHKFVAGNKGLTDSSIDKLLLALGREVKLVKRPGGPPVSRYEQTKKKGSDGRPAVPERDP